MRELRELASQDRNTRVNIAGEKYDS